MKRINRKGFTLIELLAVIVILAIIVVVTVPTILNSINDARLSSLQSLSKEVAHQYDTIVAQDLLASNKKLEGVTIPGSWTCIGVPGDGKLVTLLSLPINDINIGGNSGTIGDDDTFRTYPVPIDPADSEMHQYIYANTCSSVRLVNGKIQILLVAKTGGKFSDSRRTIYAFSMKD